MCVLLGRSEGSRHSRCTRIWTASRCDHFGLADVKTHDQRLCVSREAASIKLCSLEHTYLPPISLINTEHRLGLCHGRAIGGQRRQFPYQSDLSRSQEVPASKQLRRRRDGDVTAGCGEFSTKLLPFLFSRPPALCQNRTWYLL